MNYFMIKKGSDVRPLVSLFGEIGLIIRAAIYIYKYICIAFQLLRNMYFAYSSGLVNVHYLSVNQGNLSSKRINYVGFLGATPVPKS